MIVGLNLAPKTGIAAGVSDNKLIVYPNPATDELTIQYGQAGAIHLYNAMGQLMLSGQLAPGATVQTFAIGKLSAGLYSIKLQDADGNVCTRQFIKQ